MNQQEQARLEALGPAERVIQSLTQYVDHIYHGRPGCVQKAPNSPTGTTWFPVAWVEEEGKKVVYAVTKTGKKSTRTKIGTLNDKSQIKNGRASVGEYRTSGLYKEMVAYCYQQIADVWRMDNELAARWASWAFSQDHRDLKVLLCAFMLVQSRKGDPVVEDGKILFHDEDYRDVGEAMCLLRAKADLNPKLLARVGDILFLPEIAEINRKLKFGASARNAVLGRYYKVVRKWLEYREENTPMLEGLVKAGYRTTVMKLVRRVGYVPSSPKFFEILKWKQNQAKDGRRTVAIGVAFEKETWNGKTEEEVCEIISKEKPNWKRIVGMLPSNVGMTRAVVAAAVESGCLSNQDLIILTPTLEELGLLKVPSVEKKWKAATDAAENQRAANIVKNVKTEKAKKGLQEAADKAAEKALKEVTKDLRVYCIIDKSGSMQGALEKAQEYLTRFLGGFPLDRLHVSVFNTMGSELFIRSPNAAAVRQAFAGHMAGGGTSYRQGVVVLAKHLPKPEEDALMIFVGDEEDNDVAGLVKQIRDSNINPVAFGLLKVAGGHGDIVTRAAAELRIPCLPIKEAMFTSNDPYAITRVLRNLISSTPVGVATGVAKARKSLLQEVLSTELLKKPVWA